ncbi:hypothetical protein BKA59DRAFT_300122 [Fusarium tricinctum]|uniref:Altered inheritance of mitochondria protein 11 n=2 Tax=Fusarium tricinctum species complex TaxID=679429 RepID=A0A8K0RQY3_9HYPO|nr:hypothetical protein BKA59DRAFT_300122 [Fusarium tricinctum]
MPIIASLVRSWLGVPTSDNAPTPEETTPVPQTLPNPSEASTPATSSPILQQTSTITARPEPSWNRSLKQFGLLLSGAGFLAASVAVSRRSVLRMRRSSIPKFYSSNRQLAKFDAEDRSFLAAQALGLATLNVMSFGVLLVGGISWAYDLSSIEELQQRTRAVTRRPGAMNPEEEKAMEEMMEDLMGKLGMEKPQKPSDVPNEDEK